MKVYNKDKTEILDFYDLNLGYLVSDTIQIIQPEIKAVQEQGHYETIAEYHNGGKDVKWVVDVEGVEYRPEQTLEEDIQVYIPYTDIELQKIKQRNYENNIVNKIRERYTIDQELAILRQRDSKPKEFAEYNDYVEQCKSEVKNNLTATSN